MTGNEACGHEPASDLKLEYRHRSFGNGFLPERPGRTSSAPFTAVSGGGEYYLLNCEASSAEFGRIIFFNPGSVDFELTISIYDSLMTLFQSVLAAYEKGFFRVGEKGYLDVSDYGELNRLNRKLNPRSGYWKLYNW